MNVLYKNVALNSSQLRMMARKSQKLIYITFDPLQKYKKCFFKLRNYRFIVVLQWSFKTASNTLCTKITKDIVSVSLHFRILKIMKVTFKDLHFFCDTRYINIDSL